MQVAPNKTLDRERQSVLRMEVEAFDTPKSEANRLKTSAAILVDVLDVDDNTPSFEKPAYIGKSAKNTLLQQS